MQLQPGERSILARFKFWEQAEEAVQELKQRGYTAVQIDRIGAFGFDPEADRDRPVLGAATSLAGTTLFGHDQALGDDDVRVLMAAMPESSGMAGPKAYSTHNVLVTVVTNEQRLDEAVTLLQGHGAKV